MIKKKKLFSTIAAVAVGTIAGTGLLMKPVAAFAGEHEGTEQGDHKCSGDKKCSGEEGDEGDQACSGEHGCSGEEGE